MHGSGRVTLRSCQCLRLYFQHTEKPCPRRITDDIPNRPADIGRLPSSLFPTEDLTLELSTPLCSDAHRQLCTPEVLQTPHRTPTHRQILQLDLRRLDFWPDTEDADTSGTSPRPFAEKTPSPAAPKQTMATSPPSAGPDRTGQCGRHACRSASRITWSLETEQLQGTVRVSPVTKNSGRGRTLTITRHFILFTCFRFPRSCYVQCSAHLN